MILVFSEDNGFSVFDSNEKIKLGEIMSRMGISTAAQKWHRVTSAGVVYSDPKMIIEPEPPKCFEINIDREALKRHIKDLIDNFFKPKASNFDPEKMNRYIHGKVTVGRFLILDRRFDELKALLRFGMLHINFPDYSGNTMLHHVAHWSLYDIAKLLIDVGAELDIQNNDKRTPYDIWKELTFRDPKLGKLLCNK